MNATENASPVPGRLSTAEAARLLGLSPQTLRQWACEHRGPIAPVKAYGRLLWPRADVERVRSVFAQRRKLHTLDVI